jgi:DNA-binding NtrC family response regulator
MLRQGQWTAVRTRGSDPGWLAVARERSLDEGELAFLQAVAGALSLASGAFAPSGERAVSAAPAAPSPGARYGIIGHSPAIDAVLRLIDLVKDNDLTILLLGENGTGKDLVARAIHQSGPRRKGEFVAVNCASIPASLLESELFGHEKGAFTDAIDRHAGMFERADSGTIFLDEIAEMPLPMQAKLLRVLQEKSFTRVGGVRTIHSDARVIAATNRDLAAEVAAGRFRMDLFYRLNVISIQIPALRERASDIRPLVDYFLERFSAEFRSNVRGMSEEALARLTEYHWPGNVRELENVVKNAMVFAGRDVIRVEDLPATVLGKSAGRTEANVADVVRAMVRADDYSEDRPLMPQLELMMAHEVVKAVGNKARAARLLGITKPTLYDRLRRYDAAYGHRDAQDSASGLEGGERTGVDDSLGGGGGRGRRA